MSTAAAHPDTERAIRHRGAHAPDKTVILSWVALLPPDAPELADLDRIRLGTAEEKLYSLADIGRIFDRDTSWLTRLGLQTQCGRREAGSLRYRLSEVREYLASDACRARIEELYCRRQRRKMEAGSTTAS